MTDQDERTQQQDLNLGTATALLNLHPVESVCIDLSGRIIQISASAATLFDPNHAVVDGTFFSLFQEEAREIAHKIAQSASSSTWQPLSFTLRKGDHAGLRIALRCRGVMEPRTGQVFAYLVVDEGRKTLFAEHRRLIRDLNTELAMQHRMREKLDAALHNETRLHQELIHRVKNNLSLLNGLIRLRAAAAETDDVKTALEDVQARVLSIGLVHEVLDQNKQIDIINVQDLLEKLCNQMETSICPPGVTISRDLMPFELHVSEATPMALLVNELITNSLKHAFKGREGGRVDIAFRQNGVDKIEVHVADDGAGYHNARSGHGSQIVEALTEQLNGELSVNSDRGTSWQLVFEPMSLGGRA